MAIHRTRKALAAHGAEPPMIPDFTPVSRKHRSDGWTPERQRAFIAALADLGSVKAAAQRVNMAVEGAYALRRQPDAASFRAAWSAALDHGVQTLADLAIDRAIQGVPVPVFYHGEQVGERRRFNDRLLMFILRHHMPDRYGSALRGGTKSPETLAAEAVEACPNCQARKRSNLPLGVPTYAERKAEGEKARAELRRLIDDAHERIAAQAARGAKVGRWPEMEG